MAAKDVIKIAALGVGSSTKTVNKLGGKNYQNQQFQNSGTHSAFTATKKCLIKGEAAELGKKAAYVKKPPCSISNPLMCGASSPHS